MQLGIPSEVCKSVFYAKKKLDKRVTVFKTFVFSFVIFDLSIYIFDVYRLMYVLAHFMVKQT